LCFPGAKFLCLYRHPLDVIASRLEARPAGRNGFGVDPYAGGSRRDMAMALAQFWAANVALILAVEERFRECSYRVRYEDLMADPEQVADGDLPLPWGRPGAGSAGIVLHSET